jgi:hypothetical protein
MSGSSPRRGRLTATMAPATIAKHLGIARSSVYRMLGDAA